MNIELLRKVQRHIKAMPKRFGFDWIQDSTKTRCGTQACIAGWAYILGTKTPAKKAPRDPQIISRKGQELLGLTDQEAATLFCIWPSQFNHTATGAIKRISHFIGTKGKE